MLRNQRFDNGLAALAAGQIHHVIFHAVQCAQGFQILHYLLARSHAVQSGVLAAGGHDLRVAVDHLEPGQVVTFAGFKIVEVVGGRDFHHAGAEFRVGQIVQNNRNLAVHERQMDFAAMQVEVALIAGIDGHSGIAQHGFRARGGHHEVTIRTHYLVADMPEVTGGFIMLSFEVRDGGIATGTPVDHVLAAIDETFLVEADEGFAHRARQALVEGKALARPIAGSAQLHHLLHDHAAGFRLPLPDGLFKLLPAEVAEVDALFGELARHYHLGGNSRMVHARKPEHAIAAHTAPAHGDIDLGVLQHVAHMERSGDVGRRDDQREYRLAGLVFGAVNTAFDPPLGPARFEPPWLVNFL